MDPSLDVLLNYTRKNAIRVLWRAENRDYVDLPGVQLWLHVSLLLLPSVAAAAGLTLFTGQYSGRTRFDCVVDGAKTRCYHDRPCFLYQ